MQIPFSRKVSHAEGFGVKVIGFSFPLRLFGSLDLVPIKNEMTPDSCQPCSVHATLKSQVHTKNQRTYNLVILVMHELNANTFGFGRSPLLW